MRNHSYIIHRVVVIACMAMALTSCADLFDMDDAIVPREMTLETHAVTLMLGDSCVIKPIFTPDSLSNNVVYWMSMDPEIASFVSGDTLVGLSIGTTEALAISVTDYNQIDTCAVEVIDRWQLPDEDFPHETIVYANVLIHGQPPTDDDIIAAFYEGEVRGIGQIFEMRGHSVMRIRIAGDFVDNDELDQQSVAFRCFRRSHHELLTFPQWIFFDGESHGTPSEPLQLEIP